MKLRKLKNTALVSLLTLSLLVTPSAHCMDLLLKTEQQAIQVAVVIAEIIYGVEEIKDQQPYKASLDGDIWTVRGTLNYDKGGVFEIQLNRADCRVIKVSHGK